MLASLCIPTRNRAPYLARTLASFTGMTAGPAFEVVIVDDGGTDDTREVVAGFKRDLELRYVRRAHTGIAASRNAAIRASKGDLLIFCDDDRCTDPRFVADHVEAHLASDRPRIVAGTQKGLFAAWSRDAAYTAADVASLVSRHPHLAPRLAEPRAEFVSAQMLRDDLAGALAAFELPEPWWELHAKVVLAGHGPTLAGFHLPWTLGVGGNCSIRRALAEQVGLLDERFVGWGLEDTDFHYRVHRAGAETVLLDGGLNYHQVHHRGRERAFEWARNALRMLEKHDALEVVLYLGVCRSQLSLETANAMLGEQAAIGDRAPHLVAALTRLCAEQFRVLAALAT